MKNLNLLTGKTATWNGSIIAIAIGLLLSINAIAQAPPPTDPYVANILDYGAVGNCTLVNNHWIGTDNTVAIQAAIDDVSQNHPGGTVLVPDGTYLVTKPADSNPALTLKSNITFKMTGGATIQLKENNAWGYFILNVANATNVNVVGGKVQGERHQHLTPGDDAYATASPDNELCPNGGSCYGQWGMGLSISASSHIYVDGVSFTACWGDGIYIGGGAASTDVTILGVVCDDNRRQGMSLTWADGVLVKNSHFNNTGGHAPQYGIDIEPNEGNYVKNVQILNSQFINNKSTGVGLHSGGDPEISNITITGNTISGSGWGISVYKSRSGITVNNNTIIKIRVDGVIIRGSTSVNNTYSNNTISVDPALTGDHAGIRFSDGATGNTSTGNCISGFPAAVIDEVGGNNISGTTSNCSIIITTPTLTVSPAGMLFGNVTVNVTSPEQTCLLTGSNLIANITVTAPAGYEISTTSGSGFGSSVSVTPISGNVNQTIYVRFTPTAVQAYNGNITVVSNAAAPKNVVLIGTGTGAPPVAGVSIAITSGSNPACIGKSVTFTATPTNGGTAPAYQWKVDNVNAGANSPVFTTSTLTNDQAVTCEMTSNLIGATGNPATSNGITMIVDACTTPTLTVNPTSRSFGDVAINTISAERTYLLTGSNLTADVTVTAPSGYEISTTSKSGFWPGKTVTYSGGNVYQTIYVRFIPTAVQAYYGNITNASAGATTKNVAVTGSGTDAPDAFVVLEATAAITIDGALTECDWANANSVTFTNAARSDNTVKVSTIWDNTNLYLAYEVTDTVIENPAVNIWNQDAIELYLDVANNKSTTIDANDFQFIVSAANEIVYYHAAVGKTIQKAIATSGTGYMVEMAIPWAQLNTTAVSGKVMGVDFCNDDMDNSVPGTFDWKNLIATGGYPRPNLWGEIILSDAGACDATSSGTDLHQADGMTVFPSPASKFLTIELAGISGKQQIQIFNSIGSLVKVVELTGYSQVDISGLTNGLYFIHLKNHSIKAQKFIKQ